MKTTSSIIVIIFLMFGIFGTTSNLKADQPGKWTHLGTRTVDYALDRDVIHVGAKEGGFTRLRLKVKGGSLNMHKMVVEYRNGTRDEIALKHNFRPGEDTRIIDLKGGKRIIKKITFWYDTENISRNKATLIVFGKH